MREYIVFVLDKVVEIQRISDSVSDHIEDSLSLIDSLLHPHAERGNPSISQEY